MIAGPYARFARRSTPKIRVKPRARRAYALPSISPSRVFWAKSASMPLPSPPRQRSRYEACCGAIRLIAPVAGSNASR